MSPTGINTSESRHLRRKADADGRTSPVSLAAETNTYEVYRGMGFLGENGVSTSRRLLILCLVTFLFVFQFLCPLSVTTIAHLSPCFLPYSPSTRPLIVSPPTCIHEMYIRCSPTPLNRPFELMAHGHGPVSPSPPSHCLQTSQIPDSSMAVYRVWNNHLVNYAKNEISIMGFCVFLSCEF